MFKCVFILLLAQCVCSFVCVCIVETFSGLPCFSGSCFCHLGWCLIASDKMKSTFLCKYIHQITAVMCHYRRWLSWQKTCWHHSRWRVQPAPKAQRQSLPLADGGSETVAWPPGPRTDSEYHTQTHSAGRYIDVTYWVLGVIVVGCIWRRDLCVYLYSPAYSAVWLAGCMKRKLKRLTLRTARQPSPLLAMVMQRCYSFMCSNQWRKAWAEKRRGESPNPSK